jgi:hypothetical protein
VGGVWRATWPCWGRCLTKSAKGDPEHPRSGGGPSPGERQEATFRKIRNGRSDAVFPPGPFPCKAINKILWRNCESG